MYYLENDEEIAERKWQDRKRLLLGGDLTDDDLEDPDAQMDDNSTEEQMQIEHDSAQYDAYLARQASER